MSGKSLFWLILLLALLGGGCSATSAQESTTPTTGSPLLAITPYQTNTPAQTRTPTATSAATPTLPPLPTPTPYLHTIVAGNTLIGIASYYGVTTEELMVANPGVDPNFLTVGNQLVIPLPTAGPEEENPQAQPEAALLPLQTGPVVCYRVRSGGWWCYLPVSNPLDQPAENITGLVRLFDQSGEEIASQSVSGLINVLLPGEGFALAVYFAPPVPEWATAQGQLVTAVAASQLEERYLSLEAVEVTSTPLAEDQLGVAVTGRIALSAQPEGQAFPDYSYLWVLAIAYDAEGNVTGLRRWQAGPEQPGGEIPFNLEVYSLGKPVDRIEVLVEARAAP